MEKLQTILSNLPKLETTFDMATWEQTKVDSFNESEGQLHLEDGYDCAMCKNRGFSFRLVTGEDGTLRRVTVPCDCDAIRKSIKRLKQSGLEQLVKKCTFKTFAAQEPWQQIAKKTAMDYAKNPRGWFYICGQTGSGKTHLCVAVCRELLYAGKRVEYLLWRDKVAELKKPDNDGSLMQLYKSVDVLYIDDLFKCGADPYQNVPRPTAADINIAFELINSRYNDPRLLTIISSELLPDQLLALDDAVGGRIMERAVVTDIARDPGKNYRLRRKEAAV